jgi:anti-anti-sigma factor
MSSGPRLAVEHFGSTAQVRFASCKVILNEETIEIGKEIDRLVKETGCRRVLLDLAKVESVVGTALAELLVLHKRLRADAAWLSLCNLQAHVLGMFEAARLSELLATG